MLYSGGCLQADEPPKPKPRPRPPMAQSQSLTNVTTPSSLAGSMSAMSVNDQYRGPQVRVAKD
jgi:hypothetical protein